MNQEHKEKRGWPIFGWPLDIDPDAVLDDGSDSLLDAELPGLTPLYYPSFRR